jgi:mxaK protein
MSRASPWHEETGRMARFQALIGNSRVWLPPALLLLGTLATLACIAWLGVAVSDNRKIALIASGHDVHISAGASPAVTFARAKYLLDHDDFEEAQPLIENVVRLGAAEAAANLLYDAANARVHLAIQMIENNKFDTATANVVLARDFYTRALRINPQFWDAKYNLDIAMRLVRDFPETILRGDDKQKPTSKLWTDFPGLPKGGP